jgi:proteasome lid subunit RPN8/RPN11
MFGQKTTNKNQPKKIIMSTQTYLSMVSEVSSHSSIETGGIFLGTIENDVWYIIESIDPGYENSIRHQAYFEYDINYVNHLANIRNRLYNKELALLGLWHRHPGSMDTFSGPDRETNRRFAERLSTGAISAIINIDPSFRITMYYVSSPDLKYTTIKTVEKGDEFIPKEYLALKNPDFFLNIINNETRVSGNKAEKIQDQLISAFENEYSKYLSKQKDYEFEVEQKKDSIILKLKRAVENTDIPEAAVVVFSVGKNRKIGVQFGGISNTYEYTENIVQKFINAKKKKTTEQAGKKDDLSQYGSMSNVIKNAK